MTDPQEDFDQCGCEVPPCYEEAPDLSAEASAKVDDVDQLNLFDDGFQPDPPEGEPVFWPVAGVQEFPEDDFIQ